MFKDIIIYLLTILGIVLVCLGLRYLFTHHGDIDKHCNCSPKKDLSDTIDISSMKILVDESKSAEFITTSENLKANVGPIYIDKDILMCSGLMYKKYDKDTTKYKLVHLKTVSETDRASIIDQQNKLDYDFEFKVTEAFDYFKKSTECMNCSFSGSYKGHRTGYQHCSYSVICKNGDFAKATFNFEDYYLKSISFE